MYALKLSTLITLVIFEVGCGLPSPYYLSPPAVVQAFGLTTPTCTMQNSGRASDYQASFEGFELYYKIYSSTTDSSFSSDQQYGTVNYSPTDLTNHGFFRVTLGPGTTALPIDTTPGNASAPLININAIDPLDAQNTFSIQISLNDRSVTLADPNPVSYYTYTPNTGIYAATVIYQEIRRFVAVNAGDPLGQQCKPFANNLSSTTYTNDYQPSDPDIGTTLYTTSLSGTKQVIVMMYAVSYGHAGSQVVYSNPTLLLYTTINALN